MDTLEIILIAAVIISVFAMIIFMMRMSNNLTRTIDDKIDRVALCRLLFRIDQTGVAHAVGYSNEAHIPYARPFVKYTPTWPRSFTPGNQNRLIVKIDCLNREV